MPSDVKRVFVAVAVAVAERERDGHERMDELLAELGYAR
jgi:hypothetical protein